jgi:branched-subunit amino acid aminotransferase/4-amino-4-deoxychorismate lyase
MEKSDQKIIFDDKLISVDQPVATARSRGLMYGDGVFETFRSYRNQTFLLKDHLDRLNRGLNFLGITPPEGIKLDKIRSLIGDLLDTNNLLKKDAILRLQVWRDGKRGYLPPQKSESHFVIIAGECPKEFTPPALTTIEQKRIPSEALPSRYKFTNSLNYILSARQASRKEADDALMQTVSGYISETTKANLFWLKQDTVYTPSQECDLLPGITRQVCIDLIEQDDELEIKSGKYRLDHILDADAVWISNSIRELLPVRKINQTTFPGEHKLVGSLQKKFSNFRNSHLQNLD